MRALEVFEERPEGGTISRFDLDLILLRPARIEIRQTESFTEDAVGRLLGFRFDHDEGGQRTTAIGEVTEGGVIVDIFRLGRKTTQHLELPDDTNLVGQRRSQELLAGAALKPGSEMVFVTPQLVQAEVVLSRVTARRQESSREGLFSFVLTSDLMPLPVSITVNAEGALQDMKMSFGPFELGLETTDGPPQLLGAEMPPTGLVESAGTTPATEGSNRYLLPEDVRSLLPEDEFQKLDGEQLIVSPLATPSLLSDPEPFLRATPQLELDDPELRAWTRSIVQDADRASEALLLAVRSHILQKDLSKGDASALETFRDQRGDCTEHANLLAAALRIAQIPSRIEVGFVWASDYGGWIGHAWNSAYDQEAGRWEHLDAAYPGRPRSQYIKLAASSQLDAAGTGAVLGNVFARLLGARIVTLPSDSRIRE